MRRECVKKEDFFQEELERRIAIIENGDAENNKKMTKKDYIGVAVLAAICLLGIVIGVFIN
jgi:hypothetical protein